MSTFESDYKKIYSAAKRILGVADRQNLLVTPEDLINSTYLQMAEDSNEYSFELFRKYLWRSYNKEVKQYYKEPNINNLFGGLTDKQCKTCREVLPISFFHSETKGDSRIVKMSICKTCNMIRHDQWYKKNSSNVKAYNRAWRKMGRLNLLDWYIKERLVKRGISSDLITKKMIIEARQEIAEYRDRKIKRLNKQKSLISQTIK